MPEPGRVLTPQIVPPFMARNEERFWRFVEKTDSCWLWRGCLVYGYGGFHVRLGAGQWRFVRSHRFAYELLAGPIPEGLTIDHLCRVRRCVNPEHLEPVTLAENIRRSRPPKTHCENGHELTAVNVRRESSGWRRCRACGRQKSQGYYERNREQITAKKRRAYHVRMSAGEETP